MLKGWNLHPELKTWEQTQQVNNGNRFQRLTSFVWQITCMIICLISWPQYILPLHNVEWIVIPYCSQPVYSSFMIYWHYLCIHFFTSLHTIIIIIMKGVPYSFLIKEVKTGYVCYMLNKHNKWIAYHIYFYCTELCFLINSLIFQQNKTIVGKRNKWRTAFYILVMENRKNKFTLSRPNSRPITFTVTTVGLNSNL